LAVEDDRARRRRTHRSRQRDSWPPGKSATVPRPLENIFARDARRRFARRLQAMDGLDLDDSYVLADAWR
jgi:hypothetical protein